MMATKGWFKVLIIVVVCFCVQCYGLASSFYNLFNMHKLRPLRSYALYGSGLHEGPLDYEAGVPSILPPVQFKTPADMINHLTNRQYAIHRSRYGNNNNSDTTEHYGLSWLFRKLFAPATTAIPITQPPDFVDTQREPFYSSYYGLKSTGNSVNYNNLDLYRAPQALKTQALGEEAQNPHSAFPPKEIITVNGNTLDWTVE